MRPTDRLRTAHPPEVRRNRPHTRRAKPHAVLLLVLGLAACGGGAEAADPAALAADVARLVEAFTPLEPGAPSDRVGEAKQRGQALLVELRQGPPELGLACEAELIEGKRREAAREGPALPRDVQHALLDVFAHTAPDVAVPRLELLFDTYGDALHLRRHAADLLADVAPARAVAVLEPVLAQPRPDKTWPSHELLLDSYVRAAAAADADPVPLLADVATGILYEQSARHLACEALGGFEDPRAKFALEHVLRQSSGNSYLRVKSAQSLVTAAPGEACQIFDDVLSREVVPSVASVLQDLVETHCR